MCAVCGTSYQHGTAHECAQGGPRAAEGDDLIGAILGERYRIISSLTKGGMGVIYKAQHTVLDKPMAIKIMLQPQDEGARQRFLQEAKLASLVRHPNIVDIVDFGVLSSQQPYLVMELLVGQTLADAIYQGPLSPARTCHIAAQVARGLNAVHQKGIIHRDLKPANIFLIKADGGADPGMSGEISLRKGHGSDPGAAPGSSGVGSGDLVKVVDFGIATVVEDGTKEAPQARLTTPGMVLGTAEYMSPEQAQGLKTDHRVDQYALGCIMYEMLSGHIPFQGASPAGTMLKHLTEKPVPLSKHRSDIPPMLEHIVLKAMAKEPQDRFISMRELERQLVSVFEQQRGRSASSATLSLPALPSRAQHWQKPLIAGLVLCLLVIGGLVFKLRHSTTTTPLPADKSTPTPRPEAASQRIVSWRIGSLPSGASVVRLADGKVLGKTPLHHETAAAEGTTEVEVRLEGYQSVMLHLDNASDSQKKPTLHPLAAVKGGGKKSKGKKRSGSIRDNDDLAVIN